MADKKWIRARFKVFDKDDARPGKWPPPGPYWVTGQGDGYFWVVAFVEREEQIAEYWGSSARDLDLMQRDMPLEFTDRFPVPDWWQG